MRSPWEDLDTSPPRPIRRLRRIPCLILAVVFSFLLAGALVLSGVGYLFFRAHQEEARKKDLEISQKADALVQEARALQNQADQLNRGTEKYFRQVEELDLRSTVLKKQSEEYAWEASITRPSEIDEKERLLAKAKQLLSQAMELEEQKNEPLRKVDEIHDRAQVLLHRANELNQQAADLLLGQ
jgi:hypothetical protein